MELVNEDEREFRDGDHGSKYMFRGPKLEWGVLLFKPGQELGQHCHNEVEEHFYFIAGAPKMVVNDVEFRMRPGQVARLDAPECHNIINDTDKNVRIVFIKCPYLPDDKVDM
jgi:mannose-6-phosphate isomerase-like protein (cupin superfamily)